jgi:hypothetical protein
MDVKLYSSMQYLWPNQKLQRTGTADSFRLILELWKVLAVALSSSDAVPVAELIVSW